MWCIYTAMLSMSTINNVGLTVNDDKTREFVEIFLKSFFSQWKLK